MASLPCLTLITDGLTVLLLPLTGEEARSTGSAINFFLGKSRFSTGQSAHAHAQERTNGKGREPTAQAHALANTSCISRGVTDKRAISFSFLTQESNATAGVRARVQKAGDEESPHWHGRGVQPAPRRETRRMCVVKKRHENHHEKISCEKKSRRNHFSEMIRRCRNRHMNAAVEKHKEGARVARPLYSSEDDGTTICAHIHIREFYRK